MFDHIYTWMWPLVWSFWRRHRHHQQLMVLCDWNWAATSYSSKVQNDCVSELKNSDGRFYRLRQSVNAICLACETVIKWLWNEHFNTIYKQKRLKCLFIKKQMPKKWTKRCSRTKKKTATASTNKYYNVLSLAPCMAFFFSSTMGVLNVLCVKWFMFKLKMTTQKASNVERISALFFSLLCGVDDKQEWNRSDENLNGLK